MARIRVAVSSRTRALTPSIKPEFLHKRDSSNINAPFDAIRPAGLEETWDIRCHDILHRN